MRRMLFSQGRTFCRRPLFLAMSFSTNPPCSNLLAREVSIVAPPPSHWCFYILINMKIFFPRVLAARLAPLLHLNAAGSGPSSLFLFMPPSRSFPTGFKENSCAIVLVRVGSKIFLCLFLSLGGSF